MSKHAYAIIAHADPKTLNVLLQLLDDERNDIFIMLDKVMTSEMEDKILLPNDHSFIIPKDKRINIRWGGISQVEAELSLFENILQTNQNYKFIHLISGADLPIKTQNVIHNFFDNLKPGTNLIGYSQGQHNEKDIIYKTLYRHFFTNHYKPKNKSFRETITLNTAKPIRYLLLKIQKLFKFKRDWKGWEIKKGSNWVSISEEFAKYLIDNKKFILKKFKYIPCVDEIYKNTIAWNSRFRDTILDVTVDAACGTRLIDWERGRPYIWREPDYNELITSEAFFARKFSSLVDEKIINKIYQHLKKN